MKLDAVLSLGEFEALAQPCMSAMAFGYIVGGAADELTLSANCEDWKRIRLAPRVLVDVSGVDLSIELLGQKFELPVSPTLPRPFIACAVPKESWRQSRAPIRLEPASC
jgi:hypothetical protein